MGPPPEAGQPLSPRELEVLALLCQGCTINDIAVLLAIAWHTVNGHTKAIYAKLGVGSRSEAAYRAGRDRLC